METVEEGVVLKVLSALFAVFCAVIVSEWRSLII